MLRHDPGRREFEPDAFVFGTETGKKIKCVKTAWRLPCRRAGIEGRIIHDLRRAAASSPHESGMPLVTYPSSSGTLQLTTTSRYIQASRVGMQEWITRVEQNRNTNRETVTQLLYTGSPSEGTLSGKSVQ